MKDRPSGQLHDLLRRITGEREAQDELGRVAHELRRRHEDARERGRRQRAAQIAENNPRRGVRRVRAARARGAKAARRAPGGREVGRFIAGSVCAPASALSFPERNEPEDV